MEGKGLIMPVFACFSVASFFYHFCFGCSGNVEFKKLYSSNFKYVTAVFGIFVLTRVSGFEKQKTLSETSVRFS